MWSTVERVGHREGHILGSGAGPEYTNLANEA